MLELAATKQAATKQELQETETFLGIQKGR